MVMLSFSRPGSGARIRTARSGALVQREQARLLAVSRFTSLGAAAGAAAHHGAQVAAALLDVPYGLCTLVGERTVRIIGSVGLDGLRELPREPGLCVAAVNAGRSRIVERADLDRRTREHSLVRGPARLRSYAGVPLRTADGFAVGTLAAGSPEHHVPEPRAMAGLEALARLVVAALEAGALGEASFDPGGLPGRRAFDERLALLDGEPAWRRSWGAILVLGIEAPERAPRELGAALRAALDGQAELYALDARSFAVIGGVAAGFDARCLEAPVERALRVVRATHALRLRTVVGVATYDDRSAAQAAYRLAEWRGYAEKGDPR